MPSRNMLVSVATLSLVACQVEATRGIAFSPDPQDVTDGNRALACTEGTLGEGDWLLCRALRPSAEVVHLRFDMLALPAGAAPSCETPIEALDVCGEQGCMRLDTACVDLPIAAVRSAWLSDASDCPVDLDKTTVGAALVAAGISPTALFRDVPDRSVVFRMVASLADDACTADAVREEDLLGCSLSCPTNPTTSGEYIYAVSLPSGCNLEGVSDCASLEHPRD